MAAAKKAASTNVASTVGVNIPGEPVNLGGREFIAPPVPLGALRRYPDVFNGTAAPDPIIMADVIFLTLRRNYPALTVDELDELLDARNMQEAMLAIGKASGFVQVGGSAQGE